MEIRHDDPAELVRKLLGLYQHGFITELELTTMLIEAATQHEPSALAKELPLELFNALQTKTLHPSASPVDGVLVYRFVGIPGFDYEAYYAERRQTFFESCKLWHDFFAQQTIPKGD
jgi:hypothetical protein